MTPETKAKLTARLMIDEGVIPHAYQDHLGYWTIGVGRLIDKRKGGGLSRDEIQYLLNNDMREKEKAVLDNIPWAANLDDARFCVLVMMAFQLGIDGLLKFKNTLAKTRAGDYAGAADSMLKSLWAKQTPARAKRTAMMMRTGVWPK